MRTLVIVGVSGDLAVRKLLPALVALQERGDLPFGRIIGTTRREVELKDDFIEVRQLDPNDASQWRALGLSGADTFFYLSVPPGASLSIVAALAEAGLNSGTLMLEKPFGFDAASAQDESAQIAKYFLPEKILRIDHYLHRALARDIAGRGRGAKHIELFASESALVGTRTNFYDQTGALRDFGNHLLSLAAVALSGLSPQERLGALKNIQPLSARRAQYEGYEGAAQTETFFSLELMSSATHLTLASGKGLAKKSTEVRINDVVFAAGADEPYESVFLSAARGERDTFLTIPEIAESWRILDTARGQWGELLRYPRGEYLENLLI